VTLRNHLAILQDGVLRLVSCLDTPIGSGALLTLVQQNGINKVLRVVQGLLASPFWQRL